jgi:carbamoyltransferase
LLILGLNAYHGDASACLVRDGEIVAAGEEERFRRIKHWAGFPSEAIRYCLAEAKVSLADVGHIALNSNPKANILRRVGYAVRQRPDLRLVIDRVHNQNKRSSVESELDAAFPGERFRGGIHHVEHHLAHLASCFLVSPFNEAVAVSVDGFGDFASAAWGVGHGTSITMDGHVWFPHSLGAFYQAITQYLGFPHYGDEYKVMGLAPYGEPQFLAEMRRIVRLRDDGSYALDLSYFRHHKERIAYGWSGGAPHVGILFSPALEEVLGPARGASEPLDQRHRAIASSAQAMYEEAFFHLLGALHARYGLNSLALAGGCAMNSVANGKVRQQSRFKRVYIQPAPGDAGGAIGAAIQVWHTLAGKGRVQPLPGSSALERVPIKWNHLIDKDAAQIQRVGACPYRKSRATFSGHALAGDKLDGRLVMDHAYLGPGCDAVTIGGLLAARAEELSAKGCRAETIPEEGELCRRTAEAVTRGEIIGWFQGRMEFGPRALGNRSIVCDPRRADMKDILNLKIKRRERFRPFAPSILREHVGEWFEVEDDVPFMMQVFQIRPEKRPLIPAVTHVDGSGRLQTVHRETNPRYHRLIESFRALTGVPMVLNTSFNENEPVVCKPDEALDCFLRTRMDVLVLGDTLIQLADSSC